MCFCQCLGLEEVLHTRQDVPGDMLGLLSAVQGGDCLLGKGEGEGEGAEEDIVKVAVLQSSFVRLFTGLTGSPASILIMMSCTLALPYCLWLANVCV